ncbi:MAG: hypothetical protein RBT69_05270 [Spirochaetia bacterium]|nr:hypothetical protein [Spirochaetia bacterium]
MQKSGITTIPAWQEVFLPAYHWINLLTALLPCLFLLCRIEPGSLAKQSLADLAFEGRVSIDKHI